MLSFDSYHSYTQTKMHAYSMINEMMIICTCQGGMQAACVIQKLL